jgi:hypothetical protein
LAAQKHRSGGGDGLAIIERWPDALGELHARIAHRFLRPEVGERDATSQASLVAWGARMAGNSRSRWAKRDRRRRSAS